MRRIITTIAVLIILGVIFVGGTLVLIGALTKNEGDSANNFMVALKDRKFADAYDMLAPQLQQKVSAASFADIFANANVQDWHFDSFSVENNQGKVTGQGTIGDKPFNIELNFENQDGAWKIIAYNINPA
jgi:hypothetical protein